MRSVKERIKLEDITRFKYKGYQTYITDICNIGLLYKDFNIYSSKVKSSLNNIKEEVNNITDINKLEYIGSEILLRVTKYKNVLPNKQIHNYSNILKKSFTLLVGP